MAPVERIGGSKEWSGSGRRLAVVMEPALVATLPDYHRLQAAQNRASAADAHLS